MNNFDKQMLCIFVSLYSRGNKRFYDLCSHFFFILFRVIGSFYLILLPSLTTVGDGGKPY
jgi:hypothetical protein